MWWMGMRIATIRFREPVKAASRYGVRRELNPGALCLNRWLRQKGSERRALTGSWRKPAQRVQSRVVPRWFAPIGTAYICVDGGVIIYYANSNKVKGEKWRWINRWTTNQPKQAPKTWSKPATVLKRRSCTQRQAILVILLKNGSSGNWRYYDLILCFVHWRSGSTAASFFCQAG